MKKKKIIAYIQLFLGIIVALFPMYYICSSYQIGFMGNYHKFVEESVTAQNNQLKFVQEYKNVTITPEIGLGTYYTTSSSIYSTRLLYTQTTYLLLFANFIVFLFGLSFIFNGLNKLVKN